MTRLIWTQKQDIGPSARTGHAMAFDGARGRVVLFGGDATGSTRFNDTWEWDGEDWTQAQDIGPGARSQHAMVYDDVRQAIVLFGGSLEEATAADTWQWDGADWTQVADSGPSPRSHHAMAFDRVRGRIVLFGGRLADGAPAGDTWEWDGEEWTQQEDVGPPGRESHAMAYDAGRDRVVLFGGLTGETALGDTWEWDGSLWKQVAHFGANPCLASGMVFKNDRVELFGGISSLTAVPPTIFRDTWEWDGKRWTLRQDIGPGRRWGHAMAFDSARSRVVLFGGLPVFAAEDPAASDQLLGDTWEHADPAVLRSLTLVPDTAFRNDTVVATVTLTGPAAAGTPDLPGQRFTLDSLGQTISNSFPLIVIMREGSTEIQVLIAVNQVAAPGIHTVRATMGATTIAAQLIIQG